MMLPQLLVLSLALAPNVVSAALFPENSLVKMIGHKEFKELMKQKENAMKALADLEAQLLEQQEQSSHSGHHTPSPSQTSVPSISKTRTAPEKGRGLKKDVTAKASAPSIGRSAAESDSDTPTTAAGQGPVKKKGSQSKRTTRLTRAEFEAYRDARRTEPQPGQKENVKPAGRKRAVDDVSQDATDGTDTA